MPEARHSFSIPSIRSEKKGVSSRIKPFLLKITNLIFPIRKISAAVSALTPFLWFSALETVAGENPVRSLISFILTFITDLSLYMFQSMPGNYTEYGCSLPLRLQRREITLIKNYI